MKIYHQVGENEVETEIPVKSNPKGMSLFDIKLRTFLDAVKYGGKAPVPSSEIFYNQAILDGIVKSANLGREITIEYPEI